MKNRNIVAPKRKLKRKVVLIALLSVLLVVLGIGLFQKSRFPKELLNVNQENKQTGNHEVKKVKDKQYIAALHYPKTKNKAANNWVKEQNEVIVKLIEENTNENEKITAIQDYESYETDDYTSLLMNLSINDKIIYEAVQTFSDEAVTLGTLFDNNGKRIMTDFIRKNLALKDEARHDYLNKTEADNFSQFIITDKEFKIKADTLASYPIKDTETFLAEDLGDFSKKDGFVPAVYLDKGVDGKQKLIAFTFDDGPHYEVTEKLMDVLESYDGQGTFFMVGQRVEGQEEIVKSVLDRGHQLANHSYDHPNFNTLPKEKYQEQIDKTNAEFQRATGYAGPYMVRPPYGEANKETRSNTNSVFVNWSIDTMDWASHNPSAICDNITKYAHDGGIILLHDLYSTSYEGFKCGIEKLSQQGYKFVTVEELLKAKGIEIKEQALYYDAS